MSSDKLEAQQRQKKTLLAETLANIWALLQRSSASQSFLDQRLRVQSVGLFNPEIVVQRIDKRIHNIDGKHLVRRANSIQ